MERSKNLVRLPSISSIRRANLCVCGSTGSSQVQGWIHNFRRGGGEANGNAWPHDLARGRVRESAWNVCSTFVYFCGIVHLFIAATFLLACVFRELVS